MLALLLFVAAGAAAVVGVWPMALAGAVLGLLVLTCQRTDDAVSGNDAEAGAGGVVKALGQLVMWVVIGLIGLDRPGGAGRGDDGGAVMVLNVLAIAAVALVGVWCLVVLPAVALSGRLSELERQGEIDAAMCRLTTRDGDDDEESNDATG